MKSLLLFAAFALASPLLSNELPDAPVAKVQPAHPIEHHAHAVFFSGVSLLAASQLADAVTTRQLLDRGGWETNPIFGKYPSPGRQAGMNLVLFAARTTTFYFTERSHRAWVRWTGRALLGEIIVNHAQLAACNAGIDVHGVASNCHE